MKFKVARGKVLIKREELQEKVGSIVLASDVNGHRPSTGRILEVGLPRMEHGVEVPFDFKKGEFVAVNRYSCTDVSEIGRGPDYLCINQADVHCQIVKE